MYIFKNAMKSLTRSKGRNILIIIISLVITVSACVALSIRQSAEAVKEATLDSLEVTANPDLILADELTGNLDMETQDSIMEIFRNLAHEKGKCIILVTHSSEVSEKSDDILHL